MIADHVEPLAIAHLTGCRPHRIETVLLEPFVGIEEEVLLAPQHPGQCLPHHISFIRADPGRGDRLIKRIGVPPALFEDLIELSPERVAGAAVA